MKRLLNIFTRWRYRRLYQRLFFLYATMNPLACNARDQADEAFYYLTGKCADEVFQRVL